MKPASLLNFGVLILVNLLWAAQYPAYKIAGSSMGPATLNFWTLVFAVLLLLPFHLRMRRGRTTVQTIWSRRSLWEFCLLGILGIIPPSVVLVWGIAHSSASNAAILSLTIPVLMTGLAVVMLGEKLTLLRLASLLLGCCGILLVSTNDIAHVSFDHRLLLGNLMIFLGGAGSAFYNTYSKDLLAKYGELELLIGSYIVGIVACAAISRSTETKPFYHLVGYSAQIWIAVVFLGLVSWGLAMVLWMWVLNRLEVGQVSASIYLLPLFGLLLSVLTLHEQITGRQIIGGVLTLSGTVMLTFLEHRRTMPADGEEPA